MSLLKVVCDVLLYDASFSKLFQLESVPGEKKKRVLAGTNSTVAQ